MAERYTRTSQLAALSYIVSSYRAMGVLGRVRTLEEFAAALSQVPGVQVSKQTVNYWECRKYLPRESLCLALSRARHGVAHWVQAFGMDLLGIHNAAPLDLLSEIGLRAQVSSAEIPPSFSDEVPCPSCGVTDWTDRGICRGCAWPTTEADARHWS